MSKPDLSVVIPVRDEAPNLVALHAEIVQVLQAWGRSYELVVVDDGSTDATFATLCELHVTDPCLRVVRLGRNFGQCAALSAGFAHARGALIATLDGDGQNDPCDLPRMIAALEAGCDVVCGWRRRRQAPWLRRRMPSVVANWFIGLVTGLRLHDSGCGLKVLRESAVKDLRLYGEMHRFIPALAAERGSQIREIVVNDRPRRFGRSKYGLDRTVRVVLDLMTVKFLTSYSTCPLHVFGVPGLVSAATGLLMTGHLGYIRLVQGEPIGHRPLLLLAVLLLLFGTQLVSLGLVAELQSRTYHESQGKPTYTVRELVESPHVVELA